MKTNKKFKIALFAAQDFGYQLVKYLQTIQHLDLMVFSYDNLYDSYYGYRSALTLCKESKITCVDFHKSRSMIYDIINAFSPTHIICGFYDRILSQKIISTAKYGAFNVHPGHLPKYRGPFPTAWAILNGEDLFGITIHYMDSSIDTGDIIFQKTHNILPDETGFELYNHSMRLSAELYAEKLEDILCGNYEPNKQTRYGTYYGNIPSHVQIDWRKPSRYICNEVRVHAPPYYPAYSFVKNKCILFKKCFVFDTKEHTSQGPGKILEVFKNGTFLVSSVDGCVLVEDYECIPKDIHGSKFNHVFKGLRFNY